MALRAGSPDEWVKFFKESGIEDEAAVRYSQLFAEQNLTGEHLQDLDMGLLKSIGITSAGHALNILRLVKAEDVKPKDLPTGCSPVFKPPASAARLPEIRAEMTHPQFRKLRTDWSVYKQITSLPTEHIANHLYSACSSEVQTSLINMHADWASLSEEALLTAIQHIATRQTNPAVHRMNFRKILQNENETIKEFTVRLRSAAIDCEFCCPSCKADISSASIHDQFISGLNNEILQTDILAKADKLSELEEVIKHA